MSFRIDDAWQRGIRDRFLLPYYRSLAHEGMFNVIDGTDDIVVRIQRDLHIDTILTMSDGGLRTIDEKIVRWKGKAYEAYALETMSCTVPGREKEGWMKTSQVHYIAYVFEREHDALVHFLPRKELQEWFRGVEKNYAITRTDQINRSECRVVPIADVVRALPPFRRVVLRGDPGGGALRRPLRSLRRRARRAGEPIALVPLGATLPSGAGTQPSNVGGLGRAS